MAASFTPGTPNSSNFYFGPYPSSPAGDGPSGFSRSPSATPTFADAQSDGFNGHFRPGTESSAAGPGSNGEAGGIAPITSAHGEFGAVAGPTEEGHGDPAIASEASSEAGPTPSGQASVVGPNSENGGTKEAWRKRKQMLLAEARSYVPANLQLHGLRPPPSLLSQPSSAPTFPGPSSSPGPANSISTPASGAASATAVLRWDDPNIRSDMIRMIDQWLGDEGFGATRQVLLDEAGIKAREREEAALEGRKLRKALLDGDWLEVDKLCSKPLVKNHKAFLYAVYKQQFLEHIEHREFQKAFTFLNKRLKPLEHYQPHSSEFRDLCYLLSAKAVTDAPSFRAWEGIQPSRERLVSEFSAMLEQDRMERDSATLGIGPGSGSGTGAGGSYVYVPPRRLLTLLHQAVAYQVEFARYHPKKAPVVSGLLHDYTGFIVPNAVAATLRGHRRNVKSVRFVGDEGRMLVSGSSDNTLRLWDTASARCEAVLEGHSSRIWEVDSTRSGKYVASASGDATVKVWDVQSRACKATLSGGLGDVYSCRLHPDENHVVAGGYDKLVRMYDINTGTIIKTFTGHQLGVSSTIFNPLGNLIVTGSKDTTIRFWDVVSGLCIRTITSHLGEVTSVEMNENGTLLLSSSKDNSNRLWDVRMLRPLQRFKGHQNTSKNFIRSSFAHTSLLVGGSEDGLIYMWDQESSEVLQTLAGHGLDARPGRSNRFGPSSQHNGGLGGMDRGGAGTSVGGVGGGACVAYGAVWNRAQSLLASCGDDGTVKTWVWDDKEKRDDEDEREHSRHGATGREEELPLRPKANGVPDADLGTGPQQ